MRQFQHNGAKGRAVSPQKWGFPPSGRIEQRDGETTRHGSSGDGVGLHPTQTPPHPHQHPIHIKASEQPRDTDGGGRASGSEQINAGQIDVEVYVPVVKPFIWALIAPESF